MVLAAAMIAIALGPATAVAAESDRVVREPRFAIGFELQASKGYEIDVFALSHRRVTLRASRGAATATYTVPGRATSKGIEAEFGALGAVDVRFSGSVIPGFGKRGKRCKGRDPILQVGSFRGRIRFEGENQFTVVDRARANGVFLRTFRRACEKRDRRRRSDRSSFLPPGLKLPRIKKTHTGLTVRSKQEGVRNDFFALATEFEIRVKGKSESFSFALLGVELHQRVGQMAIAREVFSVGEEGSLLVNDPGKYPAVATVTLPKPFSGTATYRQETPRSEPTWTGSLGVRLPGAGLVPLTGENFAAELCRAYDDDKFFACQRKQRQSLASLARPLLAQGSGSHSQPLADVRLSWSR